MTACRRLVPSILLLILVLSQTRSQELLGEDSVGEDYDGGGGGGTMSPRDRFGNDTLLYEDEMKEIRRVTSNITNTISYLDVMVNKIMKASGNNKEFIELRQHADQASRIPFKVALTWMRNLCDNVLEDAKISYDRIAAFRKTIDADAADPAFIRTLRGELSRCESTIAGSVDQLKRYKSKLGSSSSADANGGGGDTARPDQMVTGEKFPDSHKYYYLDKLYGPQHHQLASQQHDDGGQLDDGEVNDGEVNNATSSIGASENFKNRLINILKYYNVYVPTADEELAAAEGAKPTKQRPDDGSATTYDDYYGTGDKSHNPMPSHYPDESTPQDSDTMRSLVHKGAVQVHEVLESHHHATPPTEPEHPTEPTTTTQPHGNATTPTHLPPHPDTTTGESTTMMQSAKNRCIFDTKLIVMIVLLSLTPFLLVAFCLYFSFCRKTEKVTPERCGGGGGGGEVGTVVAGPGGATIVGVVPGGIGLERKYNDVTSKSSMSEHVKINMLPQK